MTSNKNYYVIDTSSLIELNRKYPIEVFPSLWKKVEELISKSALISHKEVFNEVCIQDDKLKEWAKKQRTFFRDITPKQIEIVKGLLNQYPSLSTQNNDRYAADVFVIALAIELQQAPQQTLFPNGHLIVTEEKIRGNKLKIPFVCQSFNIKCIDILEMYRAEGWTF